MQLVANSDDLYVRDALEQGTHRVHRRDLQPFLYFVDFHYLVKMYLMVKEI